MRDEAIKVYTYMVQPLVSIGLQTLLNDVPGCTFAPPVGDWQSFYDALEADSNSSEILVVADYDVDDDAAYRLLAALKQAKLNFYILFLLSAASDEEAVLQALRVGADGYILHSATPDVVLRAITTMRDGKSFVEPAVASYILSEMRKPMHMVLDTDIRVDLSDRERMLLQLSADGMSNVQIADVLGLREKTIRNLWSSLFEKIGMNDRTQAVLWAIRTGEAELR